MPYPLVLALAVIPLIACSATPEELRSKATGLEEQRTQLVAELWADFQSQSKLGALDRVAARAQPKGNSAGEEIARGVMNSLLHSVKSGFREAFEAQVEKAGDGKVVNSGVAAADAYFTKAETRAKCRQANSLRAEADALRAKLAKQ